MAFKFKKIPAGERCQNKAYIVLLGLTGAGKTTTLNFLFDGEELTKTESYASATSQILEYSVAVPTKDFGDVELRIIDTPGFGDTRQKPLERDAQFMATFDSYLQSHSDLKSCYPTTVLMVVKYNDDRIDGETSHFIQMLKAIDNLLAKNKLIDKGSDNLQSCNLIFVLTHTMSEDDEKLQADPSAKIKLIEGLVKRFTSIPTPIQVIMAENKPQLYKDKLSMMNGYYKLPNGQYYPPNLFRKIQSVTVKSNDPIGETIIRTAYKNPKGLSKKQLKIKTELLPPTEKSVKELFTTLNDTRFHIEVTQVSKRLSDLWNNLDEKLTKPYFNTLQITQAKFHERGIQSVDQIPDNSKVETLKLISELPINPPLIKVLESLGVSPPELPDKTLGVGHFYTFLNDVVLPVSPFVMQEMSYPWTEIGFKAPSCVKACEVEEKQILVKQYNSIVSYQKERLKLFNVDGEISAERFENKPKPGHNIVKGKNQLHEISGIREYRLYEIMLKPKPTLKVQFKTALEELKRMTFSVSNEQVKNKWIRFFESYGTHVVDSVYAGGYIEINAVRKNPEENEFTPIDKVFEIVATLLANVGCKLPPNLQRLPEDWDFFVNFKGGNEEGEKKLDVLYTDKGIENYKKWVNSLRAHPIRLESEIKLKNLVIFLQESSPDFAEQMDSAMKSLTGVTGFVKPSSESEIVVEPPREEIVAPQKTHWYQRVRYAFGGRNTL